MKLEEAVETLNGMLEGWSAQEESALRIVLEYVSGLEAERDEAIVLAEARLVCVNGLQAKIEAALSWVKPHPRSVSDAQTIDRMVKALKGE